MCDFNVYLFVLVIGYFINGRIIRPDWIVGITIGYLIGNFVIKPIIGGIIDYYDNN